MKKITFYFLLFTCILQIHAQSNITFSVDMSGQTGFTTVYVSGTLNGWSGDSNPLSDPDGDGVWETTLTLNDGYYEYKFSLDNWNAEETLTQSMVGTVTNYGNTNRFVNVSGSDISLPTVPFGGTNVASGPYSVTFNVDMTNYTGSFGIVNLNGNNVGAGPNQGLGAWCGGCITLSDDDGDNIYSTTVNLEAYCYEFKFTLDGWGDQEEFTADAPGTVTNGGFTNRFLSVDKNMTVNAVWNTPAVLSTPPAKDDLFDTVKMFPNPAKDTVQFSVNSNENLDIEIFDMIGKSVLRVNDVQNEVNISDLNSGLYFVQMTLGTQQATKKLIVN